MLYWKSSNDSKNHRTVFEEKRRASSKHVVESPKRYYTYNHSLNSPEAIESESPVVKRQLNIIVLRGLGFPHPRALVRTLWLASNVRKQVYENFLKKQPKGKVRKQIFQSSWEVSFKFIRVRVSLQKYPSKWGFDVNQSGLLEPMELCRALRDRKQHRGWGGVYGPNSCKGPRERWQTQTRKKGYVLFFLSKCEDMDDSYLWKRSEAFGKMRRPSFLVKRLRTLCIQS